MSDVACNFAVLSVFDAKYDVTWSFQYSLCGPPDATGGISTFLFDGTLSTITGGGLSTGLAYGPSTSAGVSGAMIGIGLDSTGLFATTGVGFSTGVSQASANTAILRTGETFNYQGAFSLPFNVVDSSEVFKTLRFTLTDVGQTLRVHQYNTSTKHYSLLGQLSTNCLYTNDTPVRIGVSFATPVSGSQKCIFKIKDLHFQGKVID